MRFIIASLFLLLSFNLLNAAPVDEKLHNKCLYPAIYIGRVDKSGYGSGIIVRSDMVSEGLYKNVFLTCGHVADEKIVDYEVRQYIYEDWSDLKTIKSYPAVFHAVNMELDLAVGVFYSSEKMPTAEMDFYPKMYIGTDVFRIGFGFQDDPRLDYGKLTWHKKNTGRSYYRTSIMTGPGDSGSALFHDYKVVGIIVTIRLLRGVPVFGISYAVPLYSYKDWNYEKNNFLDFVWDQNKELPKLQFRYLNFKNYSVVK
jgi:hypothetical protein